jgi:predicted nucleic acid-binding protein
MHSVVIADTSCFILLLKINEIDLLRKTYSSVYTTPEVASEFKQQLPEWIIIQPVKNIEKFHALEKELDAGEASAITLSYEVNDAVLILDDLGARKVARRLKIFFTGTFGVMIKAKQNGVISSVRPILTKVRETNFRFSEEVFLQTLKEANEL